MGASLMRRPLGVAAMVWLACVASPAGTLVGQSAPLTDQQISAKVEDAVSGSPLFTMFDDVSVRLADGVATLTGFVTTSNKSTEFMKLASRVRGVQQVVNQIETLPASMMDDDYNRLRAEFGERGALEVVLQTCNFAFMNRFTDNLGLPSEDEAIRVYREVYGGDWKK